MDYETFEHEADVGVRGFGDTIEESFANCARAMFTVMFDLEAIETKKTVEVECDAPDKEMLLVEWLNELIYHADVEDMALSDFEVKIKGDKLTGLARGEKFDPEKHHPKTEVKAATYSQLKVEKSGGRYTVQCVVDV